MRILITDSSSRYISRALSESFKELGHESMVIFDDRGFYLRGFHALTLSPFRNGARRLLSICKRRTGAALEKAVSAFRRTPFLLFKAITMKTPPFPGSKIAFISRLSIGRYTTQSFLNFLIH